jgi:hypothetical protein
MPASGDSRKKADNFFFASVICIGQDNRDFDAASRDDLRPAMGRLIDDFTEFILGFLQLPRVFHESPIDV